MVGRVRLAGAVAALLLVGPGCSREQWNRLINPPGDGEPVATYTYTAKDTAEAELMALYLSGELHPPGRLTNPILHDLASIRSTYADSLDSVFTTESGPKTVVGVRIRFKPPWAADHIGIGFDDSTLQEVATGQYRAWDELNREFRMVEARRVISRWYTLRFDGRYHPRRLSERYAELPGVTSAYADYWAGDFSTIYPLERNGSMTYAFRWGGGDCPAGCTEQAYWYFVMEGSTPRYVRCSDTPCWAQIQENRDRFRREWGQ